MLLATIVRPNFISIYHQRTPSKSSTANTNEMYSSDIIYALLCEFVCECVLGFSAEHINLKFLSVPNLSRNSVCVSDVDMYTVYLLCYSKHC